MRTQLNTKSATLRSTQTMECTMMNTTQEVNMKSSPVRWRTVVVMLTLAVLTGFGLPFASAQTKVIVEYGADTKTSELFQLKMEELLASINDYQLRKTDTFPKGKGIQDLKNLIEEGQLISNFDTLGTVSIQFNNTYELQRIFLRPINGKNYDYKEFTFILSKSGELLQVRPSKLEHNLDRVLTRDIKTDDEEQSKLNAFLTEYQRIFSEKDKVALASLFSDDALIVVGTKSRRFNGFEFNRNETQAYVDRMKARTFVPSNAIEVVFEEMNYFRHPDLKGVYAVTAKQHWNTTAYSDVGYIFFIVDFNGEVPVILARQWQESMFEASRFSDVAPDPLVTQIVEVDVAPIVGLQLNQGSILLGVQTPDTSLLNPDLVKSWLSDRTLRFNGIQINQENISKVDSAHVKIPFSIAATETFTQSVTASIEFRETSTLKGYKSDVTLYLNRENELAFIALEEGETAPQYSTPDLWSELTLTVKPDSVNVTVSGTDSLVLSTFTMADSLKSLRLIEGTYVLDFSRNGYISMSKSIELKRGRNEALSIQLEPVQIAPVASVQPSPAATGQGFFAKYKYWILGGAGAVIAGGALLLLQDDPTPGIPIPPGRPLGMQ